MLGTIDFTSLLAVPQDSNTSKEIEWSERNGKKQKLAWVHNKSFSEPYNQRMARPQNGTKVKIGTNNVVASILTKINPNGAVFFFKDVSILSREETCKKKIEQFSTWQKCELLNGFVSCTCNIIIKHVSSNKCYMRCTTSQWHPKGKSSDQFCSIRSLEVLQNTALIPLPCPEGKLPPWRLLPYICKETTSWPGSNPDL